jgi:hypothetical protein
MYRGSRRPRPFKELLMIIKYDPWIMILDVAESDLGQFSAACPVFDCRD